jgi:hypothetical protein
MPCVNCLGPHEVPLTHSPYPRLQLCAPDLPAGHRDAAQHLCDLPGAVHHAALTGIHAPQACTSLQVGCGCRQAARSGRPLIKALQTHQASTQEAAVSTLVSPGLALCCTVFCRALLVVAEQNGNHLRNCWLEVLRCVSRFELLQQLTAGVPTDALLFAMPVEKHSAADKLRRRILPRRRGPGDDEGGLVHDSVSSSIQSMGLHASEPRAGLPTQLAHSQAALRRSVACWCEACFHAMLVPAVLGHAGNARHFVTPPPPCLPRHARG